MEKEERDLYIGIEGFNKMKLVLIKKQNSGLPST
jgi:hypothetical protein